MTADQIKVLEEMREHILEEARYFFWQENKDTADKQSAALTAAIDYIRDTSEMLEAASQIRQLSPNGVTVNWSLEKGGDALGVSYQKDATKVSVKLWSPPITQ